MSFATVLTTDDGTVQNPSWSEIEAAILSLDGKTSTLVVLDPGPPKGPPTGDHHMGIGGGKNDLCVVYLTEGNLRFANLEDPGRTGGAGRVTMLAGGQEGDYRAEQCVHRALALRAARAYFETGTRAPDLRWVES